MKLSSLPIEFLLTELPDMVGLYLFGSRVSGHARPNSDLDIGILFRTPLQKLEGMHKLELAAKLESHLGYPVDLLDLRRVTTDVQFQVVSTGERVFCSDKTVCDTFDMLTFSMYQRLELERKEIVEDIKKRGSTYG